MCSYAIAIISPLGTYLCVLIVASNQFFSGAVRIQTERGHVVATSGPYHYVRHPGYAAYASQVRYRLLPGIW